jgi:hypothetical protein
LLNILLSIAHKAGTANLAAFCFNLHNDFFVEDSFDLAIGGSILHHILAPNWTVLSTPLSRGHRRIGRGLVGEARIIDDLDCPGRGRRPGRRTPHVAARRSRKTSLLIL